MRPLRIGTRGSALALWQATTVAAALRAGGTAAEIVPITTQGDRRQDAPLGDVSNKGVFVKEIEEALLRGDIDVAVHSSKDMSAEPPERLAVAAVLPREDPRDALILPRERGEFDRMLATLGASARIATSSPRRVAQLRRLRPDASFQAIRGNVDTRLRKLDAGECDALVLAAAGLRRLGLEHRISACIPVDRCMPAPGQGIVAVQVRHEDTQAYAQVAAMNDVTARVALSAEQAVVVALGGGCQLPLGVFAERQAAELVVRAVAAALDGGRVVTAEVRGSAETFEEAAALGARLGQDLIARGARKILES